MDNLNKMVLDLSLTHCDRLIAIMNTALDWFKSNVLLKTY